MKLIDGVKHSGKPFKIPKCSRDELPEFFKELGFKVGAEIGVDKGDFTEKFTDVGIKMYAVDNWTGKKRTFQAVRSRFSKNKLCTIVHKDSMTAVLDFPSRSLDFVYIDADHRFPSVAQDLYYWYWRVKRGGVVAGHDYMDSRPDSKYRSIQVKVIVDAFVKAFNIPNYYIFGRSRHLAKEARQNIKLSYLFFKNW